MAAAKVAGGIFAVRGAFDAAKDVATAAAKQEAELAAVRKAIDNTNSAWRVHGKTVAAILEAEGRQSGFAVTELGQGFVRLDSGVKSSVQALRLLHDAEDVARARHLGLAQASVVLARAAQGSDTALRRLGIIIPKLSTNVSALKREHDAATAAGVKFTAGQTAAFKAAEENATALDKQASKANVIAEIERRFGGQSARFAQTSAGEFARLGENAHQFKVAVGQDVLPALNDLAEAGIREVNVLRQSDGVHHAVIDTVGVLRTVFVGARDAIEAVAPPLELVAHAAADVARFTGAGGLLAFAAGFKAISVGTAAAAAVQARYEAVVAAGARTEVAAGAATTGRTATTTANTVAVEANTAALAENAAALAAVSGLGLTSSLTSIARGYNVASVGASGLVVASREAEVVSAGLTTRFGILGRGLFSLAGGWTTLAAVGIGAAVFGLYKFATAESETERENDRMRASLGELGLSMSREAKLARDLGNAISSIKSDRVAVESARANVALAKEALSRSEASKSSAEYASLLAQLASAEDNLRVTTNTLAADEGRASQLRKSHALEVVKAERARAEAIDRSSLAAERARREATRPLGAGDRLLPAADRAPFERIAQAAQGFASATARAAAEQHDLLLRHELQGLSAFADAVKRVPTRREITIALNAGSAREALLGLTLEYERAKPAAEAFTSTISQEAARLDAGNPSLSRRLSLLADYAHAVGRVPTRHETELVLHAPTFQAALKQLEQLLAKMKARAAEQGFASGAAFAESFGRGEAAGGGPFGFIIDAAATAAKKASAAATESAGGVQNVSDAALKAAAAIAHAAKTSAKGAEQAVTDARDNARRANESLTQSNEQVASASQGVRDAGRSVADAERGVADAIKQSTRAINAAVAQAGQNLFAIGSSLADIVGQFLDAQEKSQHALSGPQAAELKRLRAQIIRGDGGPETERAAQELASQIEAAQAKPQQALEKRKERVKREIADLVDEFNKGAISVAQFNRRLARLLEREGITYKKAGSLLGVAFADGFRAELEAIKRQVAAIVAGPRRAGITALLPDIVQPLEAVRQERRAVALAERQLADAHRGVRQAQQALGDAERRHGDAVRESAKAETKLATLEARHRRLADVESGAEDHLADLQRQRIAYLRRRGAEEEQKLAALRSQEDASAQRAGRGGADVGHALGAGVGTGVRQEINDVATAIEELVAAALAAARRKARAKSPSLETQELGADLGKGLALGLRSEQEPAGRAAEDLVRHVLDRAGGAHAEAALRPGRRSGARTADAVERLTRDAAKDEAARNRELVSAVQALGRLEERLGRESIAEERRQTEELRRLRQDQRRPTPTPTRTPRPGTASAKARMTATHDFTV